MKKIIITLLLLTSYLHAQSPFNSEGQVYITQDTTYGNKQFGKIRFTKNDSLLWIGQGNNLKQIATWGSSPIFANVTLDTLFGRQSDSIFISADMVTLQDVLIKMGATEKSYWLDSDGDTVLCIDPNASGGPSIYLTDGTAADTVRLYHNGTDFYFSGDAGTTYFRLNKPLYLANGSIINNHHADTVRVTEANTRFVGNVWQTSGTGAPGWGHSPGFGVKSISEFDEQMYVDNSGAKTDNYIGVTLANTATSSTASKTKTGLSISSTGTWNGSSAVNRALYATATGGTTNYAAVFDAGNVGIGTNAPTQKLEVGSTTTGGNVQITSTLGSDIISNGTFTTDLTGWAGANWAYSSGTALHTAGATTALSQAAATVTSGTSYILTFDVVGGTAGTVTPSCGGVSGTARAFGSASYTENFTANATTALAFTPTTTFDGAIDNVVLKAKTVSTGDLIVDGSIYPEAGIKDDQGTRVITIKNGKVGILTTTPTYPLDISGNSYASGNSIAGGYVSSNTAMYTPYISFPQTASSTENQIYSSGTAGGGARYIDYASGSATKSGGKHTFRIDNTEIANIISTGMSVYKDLTVAGNLIVNTAFFPDASQGANIGSNALRFNQVWGDSAHFNNYGGSNFTLGMPGDTISFTGNQFKNNIEFRDTLKVLGNIWSGTYGSDKSVSDTEFKYINTLSSNAQTQINARLTKTAFADSLVSQLQARVGAGLGISGPPVALCVLTDNRGGVEIVDDSLNIKLNGSTLDVSATGLKIADNYDDPFMLKTNFDDSLAADDDFMSKEAFDDSLNSRINTSAEVAAIVGDETGSGAVVFGTNPTISDLNLTDSLYADGGKLIYSNTADSLYTTELKVDGTATLDAIKTQSITANLYNFLTDTSVVDDSYGAISTALIVYTTGMKITFIAAVANTDAATFQLNSLGAKAIKKKHDQDVATGDIEVGQVVDVVYDGTNFQMTSQLAQ